ncbi:uroporphyrinogen decarboxylase [Anoxybacterium hadale]|uniref:Uroporphyrinogen decarboxylase n=1 Tax=Anoxybacterium hadale TaxID=3408580 RepID=A0ACD1A8D5_9FIRM|nr:uroporphyrinogen decarboxylase [Clostridiales bacterium]
MNSMERVESRLAKLPVDRVPNLNIIMQFAAKYINIPYGKYCTDYRYLVEGNLTCCRDFGIDMVSAISDPFRETAGFGGTVIILEDDVPRCTDPYIKNYEDVKKLKTIDPASSERMCDRLKAVSLYQQECNGEIPILGWVEGAFAEANDLRGMYQLMYDIKKNPDFINELVEICLEQSILFAKAQIKEGAQWIGIGDAAASLISPKFYKEVVLPAEQKLIKVIHEAGAKAKLHICGNTTALLDQMAGSGAEIIDIDHLVDLKTAVEAIRGKALVCGNFDPVSVLLDSDPETVKEHVRNSLIIGGADLIMSAGCEVPKYTPPENLKAVFEALTEQL